jgi:hypothetical protein
LPKEFVMQTFTLLPQRWWIVRAFRRNPLVRLSDRVGVLLVLLACVASIIAAPVAGAVGTAVYDAHSLRYAEQAQTRHPVTATVIEDSTVALDTATYAVSARWRTDATEHTASFSWPQFVKAGDLIGIWVDTDSSLVSAPAPASHAGIDGVTAGMTIWLSVVAAAAGLTAVVRWRLNRLHSADWDRELWSLEERHST